MIIPGVIISIITFPGVIIHEFGHYLFCLLTRVKVRSAIFFQVDMKVAGYVIHEDTNKFSSVFLISIGPLIINTLLCLFIILPVSIPFYVFGERNILIYFYMWLGISIGMHAFPSTQDATNLWDKAKVECKTGNILAIVSMPLSTLIFIANILKIIWFDAFYAFTIGSLIPQLIIKNI